MTANRLMWGFIGLFIAFGLLMAAVDSAAAKNLWGGLSIASLGGFSFAMVFDGIEKGEIRVQFDVIKRANQPRLFWAVVTLVLLAGIGVMATAAWVLFFKGR